MMKEQIAKFIMGILYSYCGSSSNKNMFFKRAVD